MLLILLSLLASASALCPDSFKSQSACSCFAYIDGIVVKCNGPEGPGIVEMLKRGRHEIRELVLENANIVEIGRNAFKNLRIKKLVLDNNRIRALHADAFRGLESVLQELSIAANRLTTVPTESLTAMRALSILNLKCNKITDITAPVFKNLTSLIDLNLACNQICEIASGAFDEAKRTLQNLILDNNCLTKVPTEAVKNLDNLIALHLKYNNIEKLDNMELVNVSSLTILTLTGNNIHTIEPNFMPEASNLKYFYMSDNNLTSLEGSSLKQFEEVQVMDLSYNSLTEITDSMFIEYEHLQHLNLEGNLIKDIAPGAFATTPLLLLWLPNNCLSSVSPNMFQGAPFLRQVSLANNNIRNIQPLSFAHLANLHTLDLSHNKIDVLEPGAITGSDHLTVRLQENPMVCSQDGFHVMNGREAINLTIEPNLICKTNYKADVADRCPKNQTRPAHPLCCSQNKTISKTENKTTTEETTISTTLTTEAKKIELTEAPKILRKDRKKINYERFLKLSRQPDHARILSLPHENVNQELVRSHMLNINLPTTSVTKVERPVPSRVEQRQKNLAKARTRTRLPPWVRTQPKVKSEMVEFNKDSHAKTITISDSKPE